MKSCDDICETCFHYRVNHKGSGPCNNNCQMIGCHCKAFTEQEQPMEDKRGEVVDDMADIVTADPETNAEIARLRETIRCAGAVIEAYLQVCNDEALIHAAAKILREWK